MSPKGKLSVVVLGGKSGLLGQALVRAAEKRGMNVLACGRADFDPFDSVALAAVLEREEADVLINTIAYTAVDQAEDEVDAAFRLNEALPGTLGRVARKSGVKLVHYSTDFVFNGKSDAPYTTDDTPNPESVYGESKLAGERRLREIDPEGLLIIRTSWLFGPGKTNFVQKILSLAEERDSLKVVADQVGSPSYTVDLAGNTLALLDAGASGLFHLASCGRTSWCGLASEAVNVAGLECAIVPIPSREYPQKAKRPAFSVLDLSKFTTATGITPRPWGKALRDYIYNELDYPRDHDD